MSFLLGNETCIESLQIDLRDIQETIDDIIVRTGNIKFFSWKYPDKYANELKIDELLDRYKHSQDEVDNQVAHYSLLELIIDRLILLLNLSTTQVDSVLVTSDSRPPTTKSTASRLSVGLAVKKYWSKLTHLCTFNRQLTNQVSSLSSKQSSNSSKSSIASIKVLKAEENNVSRELSCKCTQTNETAFVPCDACAKIQTHLKQQADLIFNLCHFQNIPSCLSKFRSSLGSQIVAGWLNSSDLERWMNEQEKDLNKISKHFEFLSKNNEILKAKINEVESTLTKALNNEKELKAKLKEEKETLGIQMRQYEKKLADQRGDFEVKMRKIEGELLNVAKIKENLDAQVKSLEDVNEKNVQTIEELNEIKRALNLDLAEKSIEKDNLFKLEKEKIALGTEVEYLKKDLNEKTKELNKERVKLENSIRHEQTLQLKQESLIKEVERMTINYDKIRDELDTLRREKVSLEDKQKEIENLNKEINEFKSSISILKNELQKCKEKELLLMQYPDLYGPIEIKKELSIIDDMEMQIQSNTHRINLLEAQNKSLKNSIEKLKEANRETLVEKPQRPVPLFKLEDEILAEQQSNQEKESYWNHQNSYQQPILMNAFEIETEKNSKIVGYNSTKAMQEQENYYEISDRTSSVQSRQGYSMHYKQKALKSNRMQSPMSPPVKDMEVVIGRGHKPTNITSRPSSAAGTASSRPQNCNINSSNSASVKKYICERCNKMYNVKKDLEIHKIYCNR